MSKGKGRALGSGIKTVFAAAQSSGSSSGEAGGATQGANAPGALLQEILRWSIDRPTWQRHALRIIITKGKLDKQDIDVCVDLCRRAHGFEASDQGVTVEFLTVAHLPANPNAADSVTLASIAEVEGVNMLASDQTLAFRDPVGLVIVFGGTGTGKSGYSRIFKNLCGARSVSPILSDVYSAPPKPPPSAAVTYRIGGTLQAVERCMLGEHPHPKLSAISVYDGECASVLVSKQNDVAFRPFGLDVPEELVGACAKVKARLLEEQAVLKASRSVSFSGGSKPWHDGTAVGRALNQLSHDTNMASIESLALLGPDETENLRHLKESLAKSPEVALAEQTRKVTSLRELLGHLKAVEEKASSTVLAGVIAKHEDAVSKRKAAALAADEAFSGEVLPGVGGAEWRALWEAARRYGEGVAHPGQAYPITDGGDPRCLLCQQRLDETTRERFGRFEDFVRHDTETAARHAEQEDRAAQQQLGRVYIGIRSFSTNLQDLAILNPTLEQRVWRYLAASRRRRYLALRQLNGFGVAPPVEVPSGICDEVAQSLALAEQQEEALKKALVGEEYQRQKAEFLELCDREALASILSDVRAELERLKTVHRLALCIGDTATGAITKLGNDCADSVVTPQLRDRFQEEIVKVAGSKIRAELVRSGGKQGAPQYQILLTRDHAAKVADILSEGERKCVGFAGFMTQLVTAEHKSSLIFDDPVTSLDHEYRPKVALRLAEEATQRQVIVFTHDLVFVNDLMMTADKKGATKQLAHLTKRDRSGIVSEGLPWAGMGILERIDHLQKIAQQAKDRYDANDTEAYEKAVYEVYNKLRATWERGVEDIAFAHVVLRHRDYIDTKHLKKVTVFDATDHQVFADGFKKCCDTTDAHDPSRGRSASPPDPEEMLQDIQDLDDWVRSLKHKQKTVAK